VFHQSRPHLGTKPCDHFTHGAYPAMTSSTSDLRSHRPSLRLTVAEAVALISRPTRYPLDQIEAKAPKGDGHAVLVLTALLCGDRYTARVRRFLTAIGYSAHGCNLGVNIGPTRRLLNGATEHLIELSDEHGPLSIVGFSMGGLFARWVALRMPGRVRQVFTVCSPIYEPARNSGCRSTPSSDYGPASIFASSWTRWRSRSPWAAHSWPIETMGW
jgi:pimeloyl-ACP methyl ester carboxylesterase